MWSTLNDNGCGDDPSWLQDNHDLFSALPTDRRGYLLYFDNHRFARIEQNGLDFTLANFPNENPPANNFISGIAKFKELWGNQGL